MPCFANPVYARTREDVPNVTWLGKNFAQPGIARRTSDGWRSAAAASAPASGSSAIRRPRVLAAGMALQVG